MYDVIYYNYYPTTIIDVIVVVNILNKNIRLKCSDSLKNTKYKKYILIYDE